MDKIRELMRMVRFFLKVFPVLWLASQVLIPCYDYLRPWPPAIDQLANAGVMLRFCVGISPGTVIHGDESVPLSSRTFLALTEGSVMPRLMTVNPGEGTLDDVGSLWAVVWFVEVAVCLLLSWWWWIRPLRASGLEGLRLAI